MISKSTKRLLLWLSFSVCLIWTLPSSAESLTTSKLASYDINYEPSVLNIITSITERNLANALTLTDTHITEYPSSRIGHLLKADILQAMINGLNKIGSGSTLAADNLHKLTKQLKTRWQHNLQRNNIHTLVPASLLDMGKHTYVLVADMQASRLYLYENQNNIPVLVRDYYLTVGSEGYGKEIEGDNKTPIGVYSIYKFIDPKTLPDLYGVGAFPVNYPNRYDRSLKRTGYGIWLHGTPSNTYARAPWASEGCFVLSNEDLDDIQPFLNINKRPPVILSDRINWISLEQRQKERTRYLKIFQQWQNDWESLNTNAYFEHYSQEIFNFGKEDFNAWAKRKRQVNNGKTFIQVDLEIDRLFLYPGTTDMFVVYYQQRYLSNNYAEQTNKQQYWQRDQLGRWKIIYEGDI